VARPDIHGRKFKYHEIKNDIGLAFKKGRLEGNAGAETCREWLEGGRRARREGKIATLLVMAFEIRVFSARMGHGQ
jgi:hypothetical protein